jgi:hypothetical protein
VTEVRPYRSSTIPRWLTNYKSKRPTSESTKSGYSMTAFQLENAVAFVTGTSKKNGMGRAIVDALVASGVAKIYATARKVDQIYM